MLLYFDFAALHPQFVASISWTQASQIALVVKNPPVGDIGDAGLIPGLGRSPGGGHSSPLQYSCLENPMDGGAWWATVQGAAQSWTRLKLLSPQHISQPNITAWPSHPTSGQWGRKKRWTRGQMLLLRKFSVSLIQELINNHIQLQEVRTRKCSLYFYCLCLDKNGRLYHQGKKGGSILGDSWKPHVLIKHHWQKKHYLFLHFYSHLSLLPNESSFLNLPNISFWIDSEITILYN